ncbi:tail fiber assembly protein [Cupriavidus sp. 30B13]|uniref:tail fiber assembly protein n=1 Tax=Cupriavidus sp. 30B13 TaxID=3384241 RepID=UPI003B922163
MRYAAIDSESFVVAYYSDDIHTPEQIPAGAIALTDDAYMALLDGQAAGKRGKVTSEGEPILVDPPPPTLAQLSERARVKRDELLRAAADKIAPLQDAVDLSEATDAERARLQGWKRYRVDMNRIDQQPGFPQAIDWPEAPDA